MIKTGTVTEEGYAHKLRGGILACALTSTLALAPMVGCASQGTASTSAGSISETQASAADTAGTSQASASQTAEATDLSMPHFILYLGTNDKDTNEPVFSREESIERAKAILIKHFGGYTIQDAEGGWVDDTGKVYQEYTLVIHLSDTDLEAVHAAARELVKEFNQSSVLINTEHVETEFYSGE